VAVFIGRRRVKLCGFFISKGESTMSKSAIEALYGLEVMTNFRVQGDLIHKTKTMFASKKEPYRDYRRFLYRQI
jgi:hypothetical protein